MSFCPYWLRFAAVVSFTVWGHISSLSVVCMPFENCSNLLGTWGTEINKDHKSHFNLEERTMRLQKLGEGPRNKKLARFQVWSEGAIFKPGGCVELLPQYPAPWNHDPNQLYLIRIHLELLR